MKRILAIEYPELALEWIDNDISPMDVTVGSHKKIRWKGRCGHEWVAIVKNRVNGSGCPYCSGNKVLKGFNDIETLFPDVASEWSEENYPLTPDRVTAKCNKKVKWCCSYGHSWEARISDRTDGHGCPVCEQNSRIIRFSDVGIVGVSFDMLSIQFSDENQISIDAASGSLRKMYLWKCGSCGEDFRASVGYMLKGAVCPACRKEVSKRNYESMLEERKDLRARRFRLPPLAFEYYAYQEGLQFFKDDDSIIGIPFQYFLPKHRTAIEFSEQRDCSKQHRRRKGVVNDLCLRTKTKMIRILDSTEGSYKDCLCISRVDDSYEGISEALQALFGILHIDADIDVERDIESIKCHLRH
ncbi:MAG: zinc-ribbon domain-containing protein [Eubacterium sp.]|nr:zinc-ribbon domain-containing protein [Eubacterium sp.]